MLLAPKALYIHIPFCTNKCHYCDFTSYILQGQPVDQYLDALELEMQRTVELKQPEKIETVFVGGGTPTVLTPPQLEKFLAAVHRWFPIADDVEFSMEANPGTTDIEKLKAMHAGGVNRISFGVQSFDNALLKRIGRIHEVDDVYRSLDNARRVGFQNLSIDLMFNLPGQTLQLLEESVDKALELNLPHYSLYSLKIEENTLFHKLYEKNELVLPEEDEEYEMYLLLKEKIQQQGYIHYEISNFAKPGFESKHNSTYWRNEPYYGLGTGAHGYVDRVRHMNIKGVQHYIDACSERLPRLEQYDISVKEAKEDFMMVGLRLLEGVNSKAYSKQFPECSIEEDFGETLTDLIAKKLLERIEQPSCTIYRLTAKGLLLGNEVFAAFLDFDEK